MSDEHRMSRLQRGCTLSRTCLCRDVCTVRNTSGCNISPRLEVVYSYSSRSIVPRRPSHSIQRRPNFRRDIVYRYPVFCGHVRSTQHGTACPNSSARRTIPGAKIVARLGNGKTMGPCVLECIASDMSAEPARLDRLVVAGKTKTLAALRAGDRQVFAKTLAPHVLNSPKRVMCGLL